MVEADRSGRGEVRSKLRSQTPTANSRPAQLAYLPDNGFFLHSFHPSFLQDAPEWTLDTQVNQYIDYVYRIAGQRINFQVLMQYRASGKVPVPATEH